MHLFMTCWIVKGDLVLFRLVGVFCALVFSAGVARPADKGGSVAPPELVLLGNGPNNANLLGNGTTSQVFVSRRENGNAHGFSVVAFYLLTGTSEHGGVASWLLLPFLGGPGDTATNRAILSTSEGADCTLGDIRLLQPRGKAATIVIGRREPGESIADPAPIQFQYYRVVHDEAGVPGRPEYYIEYVRSVKAKQPYCDVNIAFDRDLGLGSHGLVASDQNGG
jgi:hypothetical protein